VCVCVCVCVIVFLCSWLCVCRARVQVSCRVCCPWLQGVFVRVVAKGVVEAVGIFLCFFAFVSTYKLAEHFVLGPVCLRHEIDEREHFVLGLVCLRRHEMNAS